MPPCSSIVDLTVENNRLVPWLAVRPRASTKSCAAQGVVGSPRAAAVQFNNGAADRKSYARAVIFGGKGAH
jgi:hypothetical protein